MGQFTLAVNRNFTNQQGQVETDFIRCVIWDKKADNLAEYTTKGSQVGVEGRIQTRNYENDQGQTVYITEIVVDSFYLIDSKFTTDQLRNKNGENQAYQQPQQQYQANNHYQQQPAQNGGNQGNPYQYQPQQDPFMGNPPQQTAEQDNLPF